MNLSKQNLGVIALFAVLAIWIFLQPTFPALPGIFAIGRLILITVYICYKVLVLSNEPRTKLGLLYGGLFVILGGAVLSAILVFSPIFTLATTITGFGQIIFSRSIKIRTSAEKARS